MPSDFDKGAYPEPPRQTPAPDKQTALPNPALILSKLFYYSVDVPVTTFRGNANWSYANGGNTTEANGLFLYALCKSLLSPSLYCY